MESSFKSKPMTEYHSSILYYALNNNAPGEGGNRIVHHVAAHVANATVIIEDKQKKVVIDSDREYKISKKSGDGQVVITKIGQKKQVEYSVIDIEMKSESTMDGIIAVLDSVQKSCDLDDTKYDENSCIALSQTVTTALDAENISILTDLNRYVVIECDTRGKNSATFFGPFDIRKYKNGIVGFYRALMQHALLNLDKISDNCLLESRKTLKDVQDKNGYVCFVFCFFFSNIDRNFQNFLRFCVFVVYVVFDTQENEIYIKRNSRNFRLF